LLRPVVNFQDIGLQYCVTAITTISLPASLYCVKQYGWKTSANVTKKTTKIYDRMYEHKSPVVGYHHERLTW